MTFETMNQVKKMKICAYICNHSRKPT